ncbi:AAA family ATPase [Bombilactobacillus thymidiniphilus]|uniref:AAA family ATPase n=1 Tax=Bombilactobacillus thymidiniphilus TaxID=2923363 RepID=A0ABY4PD96_9LACO|nr:AAA family ATPase [Bombilactobacillus thymidiniphilus]UQS83608.1 AAA family ATPase [Bombilactobacillus thymidiniphilus]UQS83619.1 AAA family ATPase [Bombilactobacillus thymidiniphilus]UQS83628.1 AAA family ATPase [Bombilactobacillus thymidiniphilus]UQS83639.1 AAA family ATPase [Bombilactobacillus thymidiniphilus]
MLLLDEPSNGLDIDAQKELMTLMSKLSELEKIIIVSSHDPELISTVAQSYVFLGNGRVLKQTFGQVSKEKLVNRYHQLYGLGVINDD